MVPITFIELLGSSARSKRLGLASVTHVLPLSREARSAPSPAESPRTVVPEEVKR